ncbi:MAG: DUF3035 domain-containing protein [Geminicoccaceae bacterium]
MNRVGRLGTVLLMSGVAGLAGCSGTVQENLGLGKRQPDEFQVVRRAPLVLPPDFNLRPPEPGATGPATQDVSAQAQQILTGQPSSAASAAQVPVETRQSQGEQALLAQTKVQAQPNIRDLLVQEDAELVDLDAGRFLFILNFQREAMRPKPNVLDPVAEAQRLRAQQAGNQVITERIGSQPLPQ